ncbi:MAG: TIM barrel protein [Candidatus Omnitrophica bacterium]|nr:TIM barrel protein [Candidatus Omnitrophota bacterium]
MGLALSTAWNAFRYTDGKKLISEIKGIGFKEIELSFNLTAAIVKDIRKLTRRGEIKVKSLHNFCPIPRGVKRQKALPDYYSMASRDQDERRRAVKQTKNTIDTALDLDAQAVVLHAGRAQFQDRTKKLISLYRRGLGSSKEFSALKNRMIKERRDKIAPFLRNSLKSLEELEDYAKRRGVSLGVENRFYYREIPSLEEIGIILNRFKGSRVFYWHDTGHAQVMETLGFASHNQYLELFGKFMLGVHLHDVCECKDHLAPSDRLSVDGSTTPIRLTLFAQGCPERSRGALTINAERSRSVDFKYLTSYLKKDTIKIIEAHSPAEAGDLKKSKDFLERIFNGKI